MSGGSDFDLFEDNIAATTTRNNLAVAEEKLGQFLDLVPAGLMIHQRQAVIFANHESFNIFGLPTDYIVGRHFLDFIPEDQQDDARVVFNKCFDEGKTIRGLEIILDHREDSLRMIQVSMSPLSWSGLPVINIVCTDISELKKKEAMLFKLSITDSLTGTYNRRSFMGFVENELLRYRRYGHVFSVLALDIDHFKHVNDRHGHGVGDFVLKTFAGTIGSRIRVVDRLGRLGGEEFSLLLPGTGRQGAIVVAESIRQTVAEMCLKAGSEQVRITTSVGVSTTDPTDRAVDEILARADAALYASKNSGRNRVSVL